MNWYRKIKSFVEDEDIDELTKSKWISVDSSFIEAIAYYEPLELLEVLLKNGRQYSFVDIPKDTFNDFFKAPSKGKFFNNIKQNYENKDKK